VGDRRHLLARLIGIGEYPLSASVRARGPKVLTVRRPFRKTPQGRASPVGSDA
jgi:hypothetical protein